MITNETLAAFPFLCRIGPDSRRMLDAGARLEQAMKGAILLRGGDRLGAALLLVSGRLRVYALAPTGDEVTLYSIEPGECCPLAMNALLKQRPHQAWVAVESRTARLLHIPARIYLDLHQNEPAVRQFTLETLSGRISLLMDTLRAISMQPLRERLLEHLRTRADASGEIETTHHEIALALGTAREVVSRRLCELRRAGLITSRRGHIRLV